jgi:hypothetical protein
LYLRICSAFIFTNERFYSSASITTPNLIYVCVFCSFPQMAEVRGLITVLVVGALLAALLFLCRRSGLLTWLAAWLLSSREEKVGLTRSKGTYNANGYLVS